MRAVKPERALNVEWSSDDPENLDVQIAITAYDRRGFVRDISDVMAAEHLSIDALNTVTDHDTGTAHMTVTSGCQRPGTTCQGVAAAVRRAQCHKRAASSLNVRVDAGGD